MLIHQFGASFGIGTGIVMRWKGLAENSAHQAPINFVDPRSDSTLKIFVYTLRHKQKNTVLFFRNAVRNPLEAGTPVTPPPTTGVHIPTILVLRIVIHRYRDRLDRKDNT